MRENVCVCERERERENVRENGNARGGVAVDREHTSRFCNAQPETELKGWNAQAKCKFAGTRTTYTPVKGNGNLVSVILCQRARNL